MAETIRVEIVLPATPCRVCEAWLDSEEHGAFTVGDHYFQPMTEYFAGAG
jgi:hypothetical protein